MNLHFFVREGYLCNDSLTFFHSIVFLRLVIERTAHQWYSQRLHTTHGFNSVVYSIEQSQEKTSKIQYLSLHKIDDWFASPTPLVVECLVSFTPPSRRFFISIYKSKENEQWVSGLILCCFEILVSLKIWIILCYSHYLNRDSSTIPKYSMIGFLHHWHQHLTKSNHFNCTKIIWYYCRYALYLSNFIFYYFFFIWRWKYFILMDLKISLKLIKTFKKLCLFLRNRLNWGIC
jgi:hypothetical protein